MSSFVFAEILGKSNIPDEKLSIGSYCFFQRLKLFAIFTKHRGFKEENEWRVVYIRDRDKGKVFDKMFSYWVGPPGAPKLKLKIEAIPGLPETDVSLFEHRRADHSRAVVIVTTGARHHRQNARNAWSIE